MDALKIDDVYVVITKTCVRVAICAINLEECKRLPSIIKNRIEPILKLHQNRLSNTIKALLSKGNGAFL